MKIVDQVFNFNAAVGNRTVRISVNYGKGRTVEMRLLLLVILSFLFSLSCYGQWVRQTVDTNASFRGLSVVNENVIWASGTGGTVIRTIDGGKKWDVIQVPEADKLDFRDIEAFDAKTAYILSIGNGESSRIYKTTDGGTTWKLQFKNTNEKAFFDAIACWDSNNCIAMSDPVNNRFVLIKTKNGGAKWTPLSTDKMPVTKDGEAAFAASGTCLITQGKKNAFIVSGGNDARVFRSVDRGETWLVAETPITKGTSGSGIFSIAMSDSKHGIIVGGNYEKPTEVSNNIAFTHDGGKTWTAGKNKLRGYRSSVAFRRIDGSDNDVLIDAVGSSGWDHGLVNAPEWKIMDTENYNTVQSVGNNSAWAVGVKGLVVKSATVSIVH